MTSKELDIEFKAAVERINAYTEPFPADVLLKLYAYYKKATNDYGRPSSRKPIINAFKTDSGFEIHFKDNGIGINAEELDKVFNLYYRSHNAIEGTGLGLYITKNIVEKLNGTISVKSVLNEMTQFDITLPNSA